MSVSNLGMILADEGKYDESESWTREALEKRRRELGDEHPDTLTSLGNLSMLLQRQGKLDQAEVLCREVLATRRRVLGDEHPYTLNSMNNLGVLLKEKGQFEEAEGYAREAMEIRRRKLGEDHRETIISILNLAMLLKTQGKLPEAERYSEEALEKCRRVLGEEHFLTLNSIGNMGGVFVARGEPAEAIALLLPAEPAARRSFTGDNALRLGRFLATLGRARVATGEFEAAEANLTESYEIAREAKGATDQERVDVLESLVELYDAWHAAEPNQGHDVEAADWRAKLAAFSGSTQGELP
jgi:tetratricopeptide (TPR) repeat protein